MSQEIVIDTLFWDICLSVKGIAKYNKNRTLEQNIALDREEAWKHLLLNHHQNDIKVWEQIVTEKWEPVNAAIELRETKQETAQEPHKNQMQEEGDRELCCVLQSIENEGAEVSNI